jgi:hypothetical protein
LNEAKKDKRDVQRNRRMFGSLLGTLQKFKQDTTQNKERDMKKKEVSASKAQCSGWRLCI